MGTDVSKWVSFKGYMLYRLRDPQALRQAVTTFLSYVIVAQINSLQKLRVDELLRKAIHRRLFT